MISIISSLAQEESRSISENCVWGQRKRFADGKVTVPFGRFLGYDRGPDGNLVVNEEQAKVVRRIYALFLEGNTPYAISKILTEDGVPTPGGKKNWSKTVVLSILKNEKYKGDALLQKVYTEDFLTKKKVRNSGQVPQYYVGAIMKPSSARRCSIWCRRKSRDAGTARAATAVFSPFRAWYTAATAAGCTARRSGTPTTGTGARSGSAPANIAARFAEPRI